MNRHGTTTALACGTTTLGLLLAIAFASPPVMMLAFFAFLLACWTSAPAPRPDEVVPDWLLTEALHRLEATQFADWQREVGTRRRLQ